MVAMEIMTMEITMEVIILMATVIMAIAIVMEALEIITRVDMEVIMITLGTAIVMEITIMVLGIMVMEVILDTVMVVDIMAADIMMTITMVALIMITVLVVTVMVGVIKVVVTAVVATAGRKDLCTIDLCTILWFMELKATMVKDSKHLPNMQPWDLGHIVEPVAGEDFLVSGDTPTTVSPGLEVCFTTRSLTIMPIIWQIFLASTATNLNIIKFLKVLYVFLIKI